MTKDKRTGWLADIAVGDTVVVEESRVILGYRRFLATVSNITPSGQMDVVTKNNTLRFSAMGRSGDRTILLQATEELVQKIKDEEEHTVLRNRLHVKLTPLLKKNQDGEIPTEQLRKILGALEEGGV